MSHLKTQLLQLGLSTLLAGGWLAADMAQAATLPSECGSGSYTRRVDVNDATELSSALSDAQPGDLIMLADNKFSGRFGANRDGTSSDPIIICGSRNAILDGGDPNNGYGFHLEADHYILTGFTIRNSMMALTLDGANHNILDNLDLYNTGHEAVHFRSHSSYNVIQDSEVHDTGFRTPGYGEGIYVGSANSNWDRYTNGQPDASNNNKILRNHIYNISAENIDIKEGTYGTLVEGNTLDGSGISGEHYADSWVDVKGNDVIIRDNIGLNSGSKIKDGYQTHVQIDGAGSDILFDNNQSEVNGDGYAINIHSHSTNVTVYCNNTETGAAKGLSNLTCEPAPDSDSGSGSDPGLGTNLAALDKVIRSTAVRADHSIDHLFDGCVLGTPECSIGNDTTEMFEVDLDLGAVYALDLVTLYGDADGNWVSDNFDIETKLNAEDSFTSIKSGVSALVNGPVDVAMDRLEARYVRIRVHGRAGTNAFQARELEIYGELVTSGGDGGTADPEPKQEQSLASMTTVVDHSTHLDNRHPIEHLFDGCTSDKISCMIGSRKSETFFVEFDFGASFDLSVLRLFGDANGTWVSHTFDVEYKVNASDSYQTAISGVNARQNAYIDLSLSGLRARYIRVTIHGDPGSGKVQARELEIKGYPLD